MVLKVALIPWKTPIKSLRVWIKLHYLDNVPCPFYLAGKSVGVHSFLPEKQRQAESKFSVGIHLDLASVFQAGECGATHFPAHS